MGLNIIVTNRLDTFPGNVFLLLLQSTSLPLPNRKWLKVSLSAVTCVACVTCAFTDLEGQSRYLLWVPGWSKNVNAKLYQQGMLTKCLFLKNRSWKLHNMLSHSVLFTFSLSLSWSILCAFSKYVKLDNGLLQKILLIRCTVVSSTVSVNGRELTSCCG